MSAPLDLTPPEARQHVEERSEDLAQTRPELGHATNAIVHRRPARADPRAVLRPPRVPHRPTTRPRTTPNGTILARTLAAVFPVCGGINLEYYFSHVDSAGYGCGTKLPHNITSLLGVMDGAASDLRTGLPWQMVEIHEPVRLLIICETTPEIMQKVLDGNPMGKTMTENGWVQLAVQSPDSNDILCTRTASSTRTDRWQRNSRPRLRRSTGTETGAITWSSLRSSRLNLSASSLRPFRRPGLHRPANRSCWRHLRGAIDERGTMAAGF